MNDSKDKIYDTAVETATGGQQSQMEAALIMEMKRIRNLY